VLSTCSCRIIEPLSCIIQVLLSANGDHVLQIRSVLAQIGPGKVEARNMPTRPPGDRNRHITGVLFLLLLPVFWTLKLRVAGLLVNGILLAVAMIWTSSLSISTRQ
jgi:hypothetical protein